MKGRIVFLVRLKPDVTSEQFLEAYESVRYITEEAAFGWYIRSVHKLSLIHI